MADANVFAQYPHYVNDVYAHRVQELMSATYVDARTHSTLERMIHLGSAFWVDRISKISGPGVSLESVFADAAQPSPKLVVVILYNLPNRDCHAQASNGELCCQYASDGTCVYAAADETCRDGLDRYRTEYVDQFVAVLEHHSTVPVAVVLEPDSMANLATNTDDWNCGNHATQAAYVQGIRYAIEALARRAPHAALYLDAGHGGWLGWPDKADQFLNVVNRVGDATTHLRGFATNVANYQPLGSPCPASALNENWPQLGPQYCDRNGSPTCCDDPCGLLTQFSNGNNEHNFVQLLAARVRRSATLRARIPAPRFIIDSGRNGRATMRSSCANWCNIRGAAIGHEPTSATLLPALVDAYFWLKTPGESDGCTSALPDGSACPRYDGMCGSADSLGSSWGEPRAPEAGEWFLPQFVELVCRAQLDGEGANDELNDARCAAVVAESERHPPSGRRSPPPPAYDWRARLPPPSGGSGTGHAILGHEQFGSPSASHDDQHLGSVATPAPCPMSESSSGPTPFGLALLIALVTFVLWFVHPRVEERLRRSIGPERYNEVLILAGSAAGLAQRFATHAARAAAEGGAQLWELIKRLRMAGVPRQIVPTADSELDPVVRDSDSEQPTRDTSDEV